MALSSWKKGVHDRLRADTGLRRDLASLMAINPPLGYFPDFLTPAESEAGFEPGVEAILSTSKHRLRSEIDQVSRAVPARAVSAMDGIGRGEPPALHAVGTGLRRYREIALDDLWGRITGAFHADRAMRTRHIADHGMGSFLAHLHPTAQFRDGVLHIGAWGMADDRDIYLAGRGITIVPCYFKQPSQLMVLAADDLPPVLVYPIDRDIRMLTVAQLTPLADLLGPTRAWVLEFAWQLTTSEIAARIRVSVPAASKHLTVLRHAGLVTSVRDRNRVVHTRTPLGQALLTRAH